MTLRSRFLSHPVYNLFSAALTLLGILLLVIPALLDLKLSTAAFIRQVDVFLLLLFTIETFARVAFQGKDYLKSAFLLDIWALLPLPVILASRFLEMEGSPPGFLLLEGGRFLRLVPTLHYFRRQKQAGLRPDGSGVLNGLSLRFSLVAFAFLFLGGLVTSHLHGRMIESETTARTETIRRYASTEGIQRLPFLFPGWVIGVEKADEEGAFEIYNIPREKLAAIEGQDTVTYRQNRDYLYLAGPEAGESIYVNLKDLHRRQKFLELMILFTGFLMISALLFVSHRFLNNRVLIPLEKARRITQLRMAGEELEEDDYIPENEVGDFIQLVDRFYGELKAPAEEEDPQQDQSQRTSMRIPY